MREAASDCDFSPLAETVVEAFIYGLWESKIESHSRTVKNRAGGAKVREILRVHTVKK